MGSAVSATVMHVLCPAAFVMACLFDSTVELEQLLPEGVLGPAFSVADERSKIRAPACCVPSRMRALLGLRTGCWPVHESSGRVEFFPKCMFSANTVASTVYGRVKPR